MLVTSENKKINIVESGINNNGSWIKYKDGTMLCYGSRQFENINADTAWGALFECTNQVDFGNFPIAFKEEPQVFLSQGTGSTLYVERLYGTTNYNIGTSWFWSPVSKKGVNIIYNFLAIGKWK